MSINASSKPLLSSHHNHPVSYPSSSSSTTYSPYYDHIKDGDSKEVPKSLLRYFKVRCGLSTPLTRVIYILIFIASIVLCIYAGAYILKLKTLLLYLFSHIGTQIPAFTPTITFKHTSRSSVLSPLTPPIVSSLLTPPLVAPVVDLLPSPHSSDAVVQSEVFNLLVEAMNQVVYIPLIVHFIIGASHSYQTEHNETITTIPTFTLQMYLSMKSVVDVLGISTIYCHVVSIPSSQWWSVASELCTNTINVRSITQIFGRPVRERQSKLTIYKLEALLLYGGLAIDDDLIFTSSIFQQLPDFKGVNFHDKYLSTECIVSNTLTYERIDSSFIAAKSTSLFIKEWYSTFRTYSEDGTTTSNSISTPTTTITTLTTTTALTHNRLIYSLANVRPHQIILLPPSLLSKERAEDDQGKHYLYDLHNDTKSTGLDHENFLAVHLFQSEDEIIEITKNNKDDSEQIDVKYTSPLSSTYLVNSIDDVCGLSAHSRYGRILKKVLLAGKNSKYSCPD